MARAAVAVCLAFAAVLAVVQQPSAAAAAVPGLHFVTVPGYRLTVAGKDWPHRVRIIFALHAGPWVQGLQARTTRNGSFRVGIANVDLCGGVTILAADFAHHKAMLRGPALGCASPITPPVPSLTLLQGKQMQPSVTQMLGLQRPASVTLHIGDRLHLWEPGTTRPSFTAHADETYLSLVGQGKTPPRTCPQVDCEAGFYWDWVAIRAGEAQIDLSPGCRQSKPACGAPDFLLEVVILR
jgi:hypothetical protein